MSYSFRIRINRSPTDTIECCENKIELESKENAAKIYLHNPVAAQSIKEATQFAIYGDGYDTEDIAHNSGERYQDALMVALARVRLGVDFGNRAAKSFYTEEGLKWLEEQHGYQRILNNVHGLTTYHSEPRPLFAQAQYAYVRGISLEKFQKTLAATLDVNPKISERERLAYSLFNASFFQPTADSRFLLLVMTIEALIDQLPRPQQVLGHIDTLIQAAQDFDCAQKDSLIGVLRSMRKESINEAGKRITYQRLGNRLYDGIEAPKFFKKCYQMRSDLVHGNLPYPTFEEVGAIAGVMEVFASDILTAPFLGIPDPE